MEPESLVKQLEALYQKLMTKDMTPDEEAQAKVQLLEILSSIKAHCEIQQGSQAKNTLAQTNSLKDMLLDWDPYGSAWFKEEKTLVNSVYNLLAAVKSLQIQKPAAIDSAVINNMKEYIDKIASTLNSQITNLQTEVANIKKSVIALATAVKEQISSQKNPQKTNSPVPAASTQKPVSLEIPSPEAKVSIQPRPVPIPKEDLKELAPQPISLPKPVPVEVKAPKSSPKPFHHEQAKPIQIPKPEPIQELSSGPRPIPIDKAPSPSPIPLSGADLEEPVPLDEAPVMGEANSQLFGALSTAKKETKKKKDKEQLFTLFSSGGQEPSVDEQFELTAEPVGAPEQAVRTFPQRSQGTVETTSDPETLYQELISLEGKRYSIERSIRDLKTDRENGILSDQEYKEKLSQMLNKLQTISKRIEVIRETLD